jgi:hypothetical protein
MEENFFELIQAIRKAQKQELAYGQAEGWYYQKPDGSLGHTTPEMLGVDDSVFEGLEEVISEINHLFDIAL